MWWRKFSIGCRPLYLPNGAAVSVRLYGGWYHRQRMSHVAVQLSTQVQSGFPSVISVHQSGVIHRIRTQVVLALSLEIDPGTALTHTFRMRDPPSNVRAKALPFSSCISTNPCPLSAINHLLQHDACPEISCPVTVSDVLMRPEQKMVDTMLLVDLINLSLKAPVSMAIVAAEDDFWPGIQMALFLGATVYHVRPRGRTGSGVNYGTALTSNYSQYSL